MFTSNYPDKMIFKWISTLVGISLAFLITGFMIHTPSRNAYWWMTMSIAAISFLYLLMVTMAQKQESTVVVGGNLAAIVVKFILSATVIIFYIIFSKSIRGIDFIYFFIAYGVFSIVNYSFSYHYKKE